MVGGSNKGPSFSPCKNVQLSHKPVRSGRGWGGEGGNVSNFLYLSCYIEKGRERKDCYGRRKGNTVEEPNERK
jgi:hypothetical protein